MSNKAFEITKNVTESCADTIADLRSGGLVGQLKDEIRQLQAELDKAKEHIKLLQECDDSSTRVIGKMSDELDKQNTLIKFMKKMYPSCILVIESAIEVTDDLITRARGQSDEAKM